MGNTRETGRKVNAIVNEFLNEDTEESCAGGCDPPDNTTASPSRECKCAVENSWRFSLRVMEAMRSLQRDPDHSFTSTAEDIVDYIRSNYRSDGDLYAQVRTALRQVCSQGFVEELLENEYHLIGPFVANVTKPGGCTFNCEGRASATTTTTTTTGGTLRKHRDERKTGACRCKHCSERNGPLSPRERNLRGILEDFPTKEILHSTRKSTNDGNSDYRNSRLDTVEDSSHNCNCKDPSIGRNDSRRRQDDTLKIREEKQASPIAGPSRLVQRAPPPAKKTRLEDPEANGKDDEETTTEEEAEDPDCTCGTVVEEKQPKKRPRCSTPHAATGNQRDQRGCKDVEEEEEDAEDNVFRNLRRGRRRRTATRERELKRWIQRCREECERRRGR